MRGEANESRLCGRAYRQKQKVVQGENGYSIENDSYKRQDAAFVI